MGKKPDGDDLRSTIKDGDWKSLQDRASKGNPDAWKLTDDEGAQRRKIASANFENRENN